ncbi:MAG: FtsX-like permease family protein [Nocardioidaceae bacterium]
MTILATMLRGLRSRALLSVGSVVLTALAVASAMLGPMFASGVTRSYLVSRLEDAPAGLTSTAWFFTPDRLGVPAPEQDAAAEDAVAAVRKLYPNPLARDQFYWQTDRFDALGGKAALLARADACTHVPLDSGRCPDNPGEVLMNVADLAMTGTDVGDTLELGHGFPAVTVVGGYRTPTSPTSFWPRPNRLGSVKPSANENTGVQIPYAPAPLITVPEAVATWGPDSWGVVVETLVDVPHDLERPALDAAVAASAALDDDSHAVDGGSILADGRDDLSQISAEFEVQQRTARASIAPAMLSLILVALALLSRLLLSASQLRAPELALASLRGTPTKRIWALGMAEPLLLLAIAVPLGVGLGIGSAVGLARLWLVSDLPLPVPWLSLAAAALVTVSAVVVAALSVGTVLRVSLAGQLSGIHRPVATRRVVVVAQLLLLAAAVTVVATKVAGTGSGPDLTDLVLPVLLGVVAGLGAARAVTAAAGWWARRRPDSPALARFVAARALSRRREGTLAVLPVTVAIAVGVFSLGVYDAAAAWRLSVAATKAPAGEVWRSSLPIRTTFDLTHRLDPDGQWLMAAGQMYASGGRATVVDAARLPSVAAWPDQWTPGLDAQAAADLLAPPGVQPTLTGTRLSITMDRDVDAAKPLWLELGVYPDEATVGSRLYLGPFPPGTSTRTTRAPQCRDGCRWESMTLAGGAGLPVDMAGTATLRDVTVDGEVLDGVLADSQWATSPGSSGDSRPRDVAVAGDALEVTVDSQGRPGRARMMAGGIPELRPVLVGLDGRNNLRPGKGDGLAFDLTEEVFPVRSVGLTRSTPFFGPEGMLVDFTMFASGRTVYDDMFKPYVFARADAPAELRQGLASRGLVLVDTLAGERRTLDNSAYALALRLYLIVAVLVLLMAFAGLAVGTAVQLPERRRDAAALRVVGVRRGQVVKAAAWEFLVVLGAAALAGISAGLLAQDIVLRTVTIGVVDTISTPPLSTRVDTTAVAAWAAGLALALGTVGLVSAALIVRGARGATLRESTR